MNLIFDKAPDFITVGGIKITLLTDFQIWVRFILAVESKNSAEVERTFLEIFGGAPNPEYWQEFISGIEEWLSIPLSNANEKGGGRRNKPCFDFEADSTVIYTEFKKYFDIDLQRDKISYHHGLALIECLLSDESTMLWHRAFARCGNFSKMDKKQREFWQKERRKYTLKKSFESQEDLDMRLYNAL